MVFNYLKIAWRTLLKNKGYSFINIAGLAVGLASVILIFLYIQDELTYDTIHPAPEHTYGIGVDIINEQGEKDQYTMVPAGLGMQIQEQVPEVQAVYRHYQMRWDFSMRSAEADKTMIGGDGEIFFVDATYPEVLYFPLLQGNREEVFAHPNTVVLSASAARRLFGEVYVVGRQIGMKHRMMGNEYINLEVTGVIEDYPDNVHIRPDYLISMETLSPMFQQNMGIPLAEALSSMNRMYTATYLKLTPDADVSKVEAVIASIVQEHFKDQSFQLKPYLRNITAFHFDETVDWSWWDAQADFSYIIIFGSIGLMLLLIACINYMNLATAKSAKRSREVGVRKSMGSSRWHLMLQFFQESLLTTLLAFLLALLLAVIALPTFDSIAGKHFTLTELLRADIGISLLLIWLGVAFIASAYPAIFLSGFKPVEVLKGRFVLGKGPAYFRKTLVVAQFAISVFLLISMGIILQQMNMIQNTKLFDNASQIINIPIGPGVAPVERYEALRNEILQDPEIEGISLGVGLPRRPNIHPLSASLTLPEISGDQVYEWKRLGGDYNYPEILDLELIAGRTFDEQNVADSNNYIINETALKSLNKTPEEIIGYSLFDKNTKENGIIIGVVKDFHFESIHFSIKPMVIQGRPQPSLSVIVKLPADKVQEKLAVVEGKWKEVMGGSAFQYRFLRESMEHMYAAEIRMAKLVQLFSVLAIFVACLGLYGLASYTAEQKTKEIGIRKVLGATVPQILVMLVSDFLKMILIACIVALPLGYFLMQDWLQNFVYRINIGWVIFATAVIFIVALTLLIVAYESIKASMLNPTKALRYE